MQDIKSLIHDINQSFTEFKAKNDQRLKELEKGRKDPLLENQVNHLARDVQDFASMKHRIENIETRLTRAQHTMI